LVVRISSPDDHRASRQSLTLKLRKKLAPFVERYKVFANIADC